jgi:hypothetical protein
LRQSSSQKENDVATRQEAEAAVTKFLTNPKYRKHTAGIAGNEEAGFHLVAYVFGPDAAQQWFPPTFAGVPLVVEILGPPEAEGRSA